MDHANALVCWGAIVQSTMFCFIFSVCCFPTFQAATGFHSYPHGIKPVWDLLQWIECEQAKTHCRNTDIVIWTELYHKLSKTCVRAHTHTWIGASIIKCVECSPPDVLWSPNSGEQIPTNQMWECVCVGRCGRRCQNAEAESNLKK